MRLMCNHGFYGLLIMHLRFGVDEDVETAYTDGERIVFGTQFLEKLSNDELDFVMLHEIMHVVLSHCFRTGERDNELFNIACDIVVNSNILLENNGNLHSITLKDYGEAMHLAPNKKEGHEYTAEQVYEMLLKQSKKQNSSTNNNQSKTNNSNKNTSQNNNKENQSKRRSNTETNTSSADKESVKENTVASGSSFDDHSKWGETDTRSEEDNELLRDVWLNRIKNAAAAIEVRNASNGRGTLPLLAQRILGEMSKPKIDWRTVLNEFVQEEVVDYSFSPPDRRFDDSPFFLPDFNETDEQVKNVLFMIDTSGSMSDKMISEAYSEVKGAIDQFGGKLSGWLGFFDGAVVPPQPFENEEEFKVIKPKGGGGTSFHVIFDYVNGKMQDTPPVSIIILTDGYAPFPDESETNGIPVLWLINNETITPPWGKIARLL